MPITERIAALFHSARPEIRERRGQRVRVQVRPGSERKAVPGALCVHGNASSADSYPDSVAPADTFVHLVGTPHPAPWKGRQFRAVDLASIEAAADAARYARVHHFVCPSLAYPAPIMAACIALRRQDEALLERAVCARRSCGHGMYWANWPFGITRGDCSSRAPSAE